MPKRRPQAWVASGTVLIVDGNDDVRTLTRILLTNCGYHVLEGDDAEAAFDAAARHDGPVDLLITDVVVPGMAGVHLAQRMREVYPELKVLFVSELACESRMRKELQRRTTEFIRRPCSLRRMASRISAMMAPRQTYAPVLRSSAARSR
jgi:DNA-binding NtrC family response regulator